MKTKSILMAALLMSSGAVLAQDYQLERIEVRPSQHSDHVMTLSCIDLAAPKPIDVEALLDVKDHTQTQMLSNKLMGAVKEACNANIPTIIVKRGASGESVTWTPVPPPGY